MGKTPKRVGWLVAGAALPWQTSAGSVLAQDSYRTAASGDAASRQRQIFGTPDARCKKPAGTQLASSQRSHPGRQPIK
jgi:hypothetical protein